MHFGRAHRRAGRSKHLDDGSLNHAIAESAAPSLRPRGCSGAHRPIWHGLEHCLQGAGGVRELSYQVHFRRGEVRCSNHERRYASLDPQRTRFVLAPVRATARPDCEDVYYPLGIPTVEDHSPIANTQSPQALGTAQQLDVALGQHVDRDLDPLPVSPAEPSQRLQCSRADLDPPSVRLSQRAAPP